MSKQTRVNRDFKPELNAQNGISKHISSSNYDPKINEMERKLNVEVDKIIDKQLMSIKEYKNELDLEMKKGIDSLSPLKVTDKKNLMKLRKDVNNFFDKEMAGIESRRKDIKKEYFEDAKKDYLEHRFYRDDINDIVDAKVELAKYDTLCQNLLEIFPKADIYKDALERIVPKQKTKDVEMSLSR